MPPSGATSGGSSSNHAPHLPEDAQARFRTDIPSPARTWNYWLGGKDNYEVDRVVGDATAALNPELIRQAKQGRRFLSRVVRYLAAEENIRNFLDIGAGLPTESNTHQVAQQIAPDSRVVYVDNDRSKPGCSHERTSAACHFASVRPPVGPSEGASWDYGYRAQLGRTSSISQEAQGLHSADSCGCVRGLPVVDPEA